MKREPFIDTIDCFEKFKKCWTNPSICNHLDKEDGLYKQCIKCGRVVVEENKIKYFYFPNGVRYLTKRKKNETQRSS